MGPDKGIGWLKEKHPEAQARVVQAAESGLIVRESAGWSRLLVPPGGAGEK